MLDKFILAIESSCDDTSVAIISEKYEIISQSTTSQPEHLDFGGILPELASRLHMRNILILTESVLRNSGIMLNDISAIAVSINPGLIGSLIVGLSFAKSLAWTLDIPLITVNHMLGHVFANHLVHRGIKPPFLSLIVSGGHTELVYFRSEIDFDIIGKTLDDAAGETFDKAAKILNLGFPGGPIIDKLAVNGNPEFVIFPRALKQKSNYNFSYSGLKTSILQYLAQQDKEITKTHLNDITASIQAAIIEPLVVKTLRFAKLNNVKAILLGGGVAANTLLRKQMSENGAKIGVKVIFPTLSLCMDNAAMIGAAAIPKFKSSQFASLEINAFSDKGTRLI